VGVEDIDVERSDPISKLLEYIPSCRGNAKFPKDIYESKVTLHTPLLPGNITFRGLCLMRVPHLKLDDWDLADTECFPP